MNHITLTSVCQDCGIRFQTSFRTRSVKKITKVRAPKYCPDCRLKAVDPVELAKAFLKVLKRFWRSKNEN